MYTSQLWGATAMILPPAVTLLSPVAHPTFTFHPTSASKLQIADSAANFRPMDVSVEAATCSSSRYFQPIGKTKTRVVCVRNRPTRPTVDHAEATVFEGLPGTRQNVKPVEPIPEACKPVHRLVRPVKACEPVKACRR